MLMTGYAFNKKEKRILVLRGPEYPENPDSPEKSPDSPSFSTAAEKQTSHSFSI
jgi:hypothetical protein